MDEKIFDRVEKKYLITSEVKDEVLRAVHKKMKKDGYHKSKVFNIYFDTDNYDLIIQSIEKPEFKEKLRARSYGGYDKVFLEIKTKIKGKEYNLGYKRRVLITKKDFEKLVNNKSDVVTLAKKKIETGDDIQIAKEVDYLIKHFDLKPKILVYYERESYKGEDGLRITFDENLRYRDTNLKFTKNAKDKHYFNNEKNIIMEIKAHGVIPLWLAHVLSQNRAYPMSFSKIGRIYETLRKEKNVQ
jgi:SPX domain protein involved in polyphosphate accumulation